MLQFIQWLIIFFGMKVAVVDGQDWIVDDIKAYLLTTANYSLLRIVPHTLNSGTRGCLTNANLDTGVQTKLQWHSQDEQIYTPPIPNKHIVSHITENNHETPPHVAQVNRNLAGNRGIVNHHAMPQVPKYRAFPPQHVVTTFVPPHAIASQPRPPPPSAIGTKRLSGLTLWVNEYMQIGHAQCDLWVMQMLASTKVDRIILQRAPCFSPGKDLCQMWAKFYLGMYAAMVDALQPGVPIFMRFKSTDTVYAHYLSIDSNGTVVDAVQQRETVVIAHEVCFETVVWKNHDCSLCMYDNFVSIQSAEKFKMSAYKMLGYSPERSLANTVEFYKPNKSIVVTIAYRSAAFNGRVMQNIQSFIDKLASTFKAPAFDFRMRHTPDSFSNETFVDDIRVMSETHILIAEHGAYQSNVIYMRKGTLLIDLAGAYWENPLNGQLPIMTEKVAKIFGVFCRHVYLSGMQKHETPQYNITDMEVARVSEIIHEYAREAPFLQVKV